MKQIIENFITSITYISNGRAKEENEGSECGHIQRGKYKMPLFLLKCGIQKIFYVLVLGSFCLSAHAYLLHEMQVCINTNSAETEKNTGDLIPLQSLNFFF